MILEVGYGKEYHRSVGVVLCTTLTAKSLCINIWSLIMGIPVHHSLLKTIINTCNPINTERELGPLWDNGRSKRASRICFIRFKVTFSEQGMAKDLWVSTTPRPLGYEGVSIPGPNAIAKSRKIRYIQCITQDY